MKIMPWGYLKGKWFHSCKSWAPTLRKRQTSPAKGVPVLYHAVMIAVSDTITGPYLSNPRNPILTTRHFS
jgi:hypothetical protein